MSGPPYPYSAAGAPSLYPSDFGDFVFGYSPFEGSIDVIPPNFNFWATIISQYANSPRIYTIIGNFFECIDQTANFEAFYDDIWNIATAIGYGLDVWGRILDVSRILQVEDVGRYVGFQEQANTTDPFNSGSPLYSGAPLTSAHRLADDAYRILLLAKAASNICDGSTPAITRILLMLFPGRGNCYCTDGRDMTMTYTFTFPLSPVEDAIVTNSGVLPKTSGVAASPVQL